MYHLTVSFEESSDSDDATESLSGCVRINLTESPSQKEPLCQQKNSKNAASYFKTS